MSHRKRINAGDSPCIDVQYQNLYAQVASLLMPRKLRAVLGRGSAKTTDFQAERLAEIIFDMPGAPLVWVADTFSNLTSNILPGVLEGLERKGLHEGVHYVIEKEPPTYTEKEKEHLPTWLKPHFWKPFNRLVSYKRTIIFHTGTNIRFGSLDRPSTLAGSSYVSVFGDEVKYFKEEKIANLMKAVRGYSVQYGNSPFYRGYSFTTDMPDVSHIGEYDWILKGASAMNTERLTLVMQAGLVYNQALHEYVAAKLEWQRTRTPEAEREYKNKLRTARLWRSRWVELRRLPETATFFMLASSYINVDILTAEWFDDAFAEQFSDYKAAILSMKPTLEGGERFYANLGERHFYYDGIDEEAYERFGLLEQEDSRVLRYCNPQRTLSLGVDFGNMCSMCVAQEEPRILRVLKFIYTLSPESIRQLADKFVTYFAHHRNKYVMLYYDRAGNNYRKMGADTASQLKHAIEFDSNEHPTGWSVQLMSIGQGNIGQGDEYIFMQELLAGHNKYLPQVLIDAYQCKPLKASLENARTRVSKGKICKDKRSEHLPVAELPMRSTNPSDSFKYLMMTPPLIQIVKGSPRSDIIYEPTFG